MSVIDTLITNRTQEDVNALQALYSKPKAMWTVDEWNEFLLGNHRGAYNASDMNRVLDALDYLAERVTEFGYVKPKIKRPSITEVVPGTSRLPEGYTELLYIRSTGTQHINSEFKPNQNTSVTVDFRLTTVSSWQCIYGARNTANNVGSYQLWHNGTAFGFYFASKNAIWGNLDGTTRHLIAAKKNTAVANGTDSVSVDFSSFTTNYPIFLFAVNSAGSVQSNSLMELYSCQIYDGDTIVRNFVPCLNPSHEVGLYDIVNGVFYGNAGTGYFLPGPAVSLPDGFTRLEYIESTGAQYINSEFKPNQDTRVVMDVEVLGENTSLAANDLFGARTAVTSKAYAVQWSITNKCFQHFYGDGLTALDFGDFERQIIDMDKNVLTLNGVSNERAYVPFQCDYTMYLCALNDAGTAKFFSKMRVYSNPIYDNDVLARLYTPVISADGEVGLYDSIGGAFYGNAGSGSFVAGEEMESTGNTPTTTIVRDYYKIGDRPTASDLKDYLENVCQMRSFFGNWPTAPEVPVDIGKGITVKDANNIEIVLIAIESLLSRIHLAWIYSGEIYSGEG